MSMHRYFSRDAPYILRGNKTPASLDTLLLVPSNPPPPNPLRCPFSVPTLLTKEEITQRKNRCLALKTGAKHAKVSASFGEISRCLRAKNQLHLWWCKWKPAFPLPRSEEEEEGGEKEEEEEEEEGEGEKNGRRRRRRRHEGGRGSPASWCLQPWAVPLESGAAGELCGILVFNQKRISIFWNSWTEDALVLCEALMNSQYRKETDSQWKSQNTS
nr:uncharacterized protein LOC115494887 isoform X1 [Taeniopygia guttata]